MSTETFYPIKQIVRRNTKGVDRPFLIEWDTIDPCEPTWEPWENLSENLKKKYCKNGKVRHLYAKRKAKENVVLNRKPKRKPKRKLAFPPVAHKPENHAVIPPKRPCGTTEYSEYENKNGDRILVVKTFREGYVEYDHFQRISKRSITL